LIITPSNEKETPGDMISNLYVVYSKARFQFFEKTLRFIIIFQPLAYNGTIFAVFSIITLELKKNLHFSQSILSLEVKTFDN